MKGSYAELRTAAVLLVAGLCTLAAPGSPTLAQGGRAIPTAVDRRIEISNRQSTEHERDSLDAELKRRPEHQRDQKRSKATIAAVEQDFEKLQAGYNRIVLTMDSNKDPNDDAILGAVAEIEKCSSRLKKNLALPWPDDEEKKAVRGEAALENMEPILILQKYVYSFVTNPLFESKATLDVHQAKRAGQDLDLIIELSGSIRRAANKANRAR